MNGLAKNIHYKTQTETALNCIKKVFKILPQLAYSEKVATTNDSKSEHAIKLQQEITSICKDPICKRVAMASHNVAQVYASIDFFSGKAK